jgi:DNA-binding response OmpR family regulator
MRVLVIEDDDSIAQMLSICLKAECFAVDRASTGTEGSFMARTNDYDIIVLDNMLPGKTGKDVCVDIRNQGRITPILVLSAMIETAKKIEMLTLGADDYLEKPFSAHEFIARVKALLRRPKILARDILTIDTLMLDVQRHIVQRDGKNIRMTRKEFMLLEFLMRHRGCVMSRAAILEHVWDINADPFSNTIESHILSVRKKIHSDGGKKLIHTISGRGYIMDIRE